ncbi:LysM domain-containing protein [Staphylotrichum tortipilum]|uniref:LysM domain-containing protein n=1 Tax=Staphylotrichum tortipilum TaxID=2831512 RepID=A0AAN6RP51_9PEZI|nr:LysM domain-containing protein [Staphylotrichum longicolle]
MALSALSLGAVLARAAPGAGSQPAWLPHHVRAGGPVVTAAPERLASSRRAIFRARDESPNLPHDPNATSACTWWYDNDGGMSCPDLMSLFAITPAQFASWNPSVTQSCGNFQKGFSYCVEGPAAAVPSKTSVSSSTRLTVPPTTTTTKPPGNGIETPTPIQNGMVGNCKAFHFVEEDQTCSDVLAKNGITIAQLFAWNPSVKADCSGLWARVFVCVSVIGDTPPTPTTATLPTTTTRGNGITTPTPIQDGMIGNCRTFYYVNDGQTCSDVLAKNGITLAQLFAWNPSVKADCSGLWVRVYVCVSAAGNGTPTPAPTTTRGNGIATPTPIQSGMVTNCRSFHWVTIDQTCETIVKQYSISMANFVKWNPAVGSTCTGLWAKTFACVGVL